MDSPPSDEKLFESINNTRHLNDETKDRYLKRLSVIQDVIWKDCENNGYNLYCILGHPKKFVQKLSKHKGQAGYMTAIMALFTYNQELKESDLYEPWKEESDKIREEKRAHYRKNEPTEKQRKGIMTFEEICKIRDNLGDEYNGTPELLLLQLFTEMPPLRANDFYTTKIITKIIHHPTKLTKKKGKNDRVEKQTKRKDTDVDTDGNYVIITKNNMNMVLQDYKTKNTYKKQEFELPPKVQDTIRAMIKKDPSRQYLFVPVRSSHYASRKAFNTWANDTLRKLLKNPHFSLTLFRHIYISRPDLDLRNKSGEEQQKVAQRMCHSITSQQGSYHWMQ